MDGLLLDTESIALKLFAETVTHAGFEWSEEVGLLMIGRNGRDADALLSSHYGEGFSTAEIRVEFLKKYQAHLQDSGVPLKQGAKELLNSLRKQTVSCALVTSSRRRLTDLKLQNAGIADFFQVQICGDEVNRGKPDPQCYLLAAEKLAVEPARCLVLEDSAPGITAALAAGMTAWWVPDKNPPTSELVEKGAMVFDSLQHVQQRLESICHV
jgi:HAD superfamily hydrolase (TIGR01509 family)